MRKQFLRASNDQILILLLLLCKNNQINFYVILTHHDDFLFEFECRRRIQMGGQNQITNFFFAFSKSKLL